jgi:hypothetical protein
MLLTNTAPQETDGHRVVFLLRHHGVFTWSLFTLLTHECGSEIINKLLSTARNKSVSWLLAYDVWKKDGPKTVELKVL